MKGTFREKVVRKYLKAGFYVSGVESWVRIIRELVGFSSRTAPVYVPSP
jgi:hypothetical protein